MTIIDCRGMLCPEPVIRAKKYFDDEKNLIGEVVVDNEVSKNNIIKFAKNRGFNISEECKDNNYHIIIARNLQPKPAIIPSDKVSSKDYILVIASDKLGDGDEQLGTTLMKSYLYALSESEASPHKIIFINGGAKLSTEGSDCLDSLRKLEAKGSEILTCGTCLDFYGIKDKLAVGEVTNMYTIVDEMNKASKTIKI